MGKGQTATIQLCHKDN